MSTKTQIVMKFVRLEGDGRFTLFTWFKNFASENKYTCLRAAYTPTPAQAIAIAQAPYQEIMLPL